MVQLLLTKNFWICVAIIIELTIFAYMAHVFYSAGENKAQLAQATAQIKQDDKLRGRDAKIDQHTPAGSDKSAAIDWLRCCTANR